MDELIFPSKRNPVWYQINREKCNYISNLVKFDMTQKYIFLCVIQIYISSKNNNGEKFELVKIFEEKKIILPETIFSVKTIS